MRSLRAVLVAILLLVPHASRGSDFDAQFDWVAVGNFGPLYDSETRRGSIFSPGDYAVTASLERSMRVITVRTQVGAFLYGHEIPSLNRESKGFALLTAMDRFGEDRWALIVLGGIGYYDASGHFDAHAGVGFDYRFQGPWLLRGEAVYHHEFQSVAVTVGAGYMF